MLKLTQVSEKFIWGSANTDRVHPPLSWSKVCRPKQAGGLALRKAKDFNNALLSKLGWMIISKKDSEWIKLLKTKYLRGKSFLKTSHSSSDSWLWKGILGARNTLQKGVCYLVGSGVSIKIWEDPWIPSIENFSPCATGNINPSPNWVVDLMTDDRLNWDINKLNNLFDPSTVQAILKIHLSPAHTQDKIIWAPNKSGEFLVKLAFIQSQMSNLLNTSPLLIKEWKHLWKIKIHERLKLLLWKIA